jgi:hypothetical protein
VTKPGKGRLGCSDAEMEDLTDVEAGPSGHSELQ